MPPRTPDLRPVTAGGSAFREAGGWRSAAVAPAFASVNVDGARPLLRSGGASAPFERSDFGQASSNVAGGTSLDSEAGGAAGGAGPGDAGRGSPAEGAGRARRGPRAASLAERDTSR